MLESFLKKTCRLKACNFIKKTPTGVFSSEVCKIFNCLFLQNTSSDCFGTFDVSFCVFLKKYYLTPILQPCYDLLVVFSSKHIV